MAFTDRWLAPGVCHITDALGVSMTLLCGEERALLVDTGYGTEDVAAHVRSLTDRPLTVALTHAHHDHALGSRCFGRVLADAAEAPVYAEYVCPERLDQAVGNARSQGLPVDESLPRRFPAPEPLPEGELSLGGLSVRVIRCPGHTPGSLVFAVPARGLLLTGDAWNPTTWCFFPEALPVRRHLKNLAALMALPFAQVLCPHQSEPQPREKLAAFLDGMTEEALRNAPPSPEGEAMGIPTRRAELPDGQQLVFDPRKEDA